MVRVLLIDKVPPPRHAKVWLPVPQSTAPVTKTFPELVDRMVWEPEPQVTVLDMVRLPRPACNVQLDGEFASVNVPAIVVAAPAVTTWLLPVMLTLPVNVVVAAVVSV